MAYLYKNTAWNLIIQWKNTDEIKL